MTKAVQIFDVLRSVGAFHTFSAGLVIGGKNLKDERERLARMNILVATPGRLLQHMDQTFGFECDNLQVLSKFRTAQLFQGLTMLVKFWTKRTAY
jgi:ATP-dependent RNA helicase DDX10/DBP4